MLTTYPLTQLDSATMADFGDLHAMGLHFCDYTASSRGLTTANWGNRTIRTATRRRHADSRLLVLPNPHRCRCGECRRVRRARPLGPWAVAGPGCGARGRRQGQGGPRDRPLRAKLACGDLAGGPPPTGTTSSPAQTDHAAPRTPAAPQATTLRNKRRAGRRPQCSPAQTCGNPAPRMRDGVIATQSGGEV